MNRYILIRRLRGPAFLLLVGIIALLNQADILSWGHAWPLFLILAGVLLLAERAAMAGYEYPPYQGAEYPVPPYTGPGTATPNPPPPAPGTSIVPAASDPSRGGER